MYRIAVQFTLESRFPISRTNFDAQGKVFAQSAVDFKVNEVEIKYELCLCLMKHKYYTFETISNPLNYLI